MPLNLKFPRQILFSGKRRMIQTKDDYFKFINANLSSNNLYTTVYNYSEYEKWKPNFDSAIIDRLWFDFDLDTKLDTRITIRNDCYSMMKSLHIWCLTNDYRHICRYTGSGFDVTIFTTERFIKHRKDCIKNAVIGICDDLGIASDPKTLGDIARVNRITNTYNFKSKAKRFCIPLTQGLIDSSHENIRKIAKKQKFYTKVFGTKLLDIKKYDIPTIETYDDYEGNDSIKDQQIEGLCDKVPVCIKHLLSKQTPTFEERRIIIVGLRDMGFSKGEIKQILYTNLTKKKFHHCIFEEGQLDHLYQHRNVVFPTQKGVMKYNACPCSLGNYCGNEKRGCLQYGR